MPRVMQTLDQKENGREEQGGMKGEGEESEKRGKGGERESRSLEGTSHCWSQVEQM